MKADRLVLTFALALLCSAGARAQIRSAGTFHSYKGVGLSCQTGSPGSRDFNYFVISADMSKVFSGKSKVPGVKFNYSHNVRLYTFNPVEREDICMFAGSGVSAGRVSDGQRDTFGFEGALTGSFGFRAAFSRKILFTAGLTIETGAFIYHDGRGLRFSLYRDGITHSIYPQISISYMFR